MKTTFSRTLFTFTVLMLAALLILGLSLQLLVQNYLEDQAVESLKNDGKIIAEVAAAYYADNTMSSEDFLINLSIVASVSDTAAVICDSTGTLILCSDAPLGCEHQGLGVDPAYLQLVYSREYISGSGKIGGLYEDARYMVSTAIRSREGENLGIVIVSSPMTGTVQVMKRLSRIFLFTAVTVVLIAVIVATVYVKLSSNPLRDMARTATAFGHGDLKARTRVREDSPQEIRELALAFNDMATSLEQSENQRKEFVANVSHELKTPMTTIGGYVDGILDGTIPPEQQKRYLQIVSDETKRLHRLVRSMLDISRLQEQGGFPEEKKSRFEITECIGQTLITFEQKITAKRLEVEVDLPELPLYTYACQDAITQVIYNLLDNGVKFCPQEGTLGIRLHGDGKKAYISIFNTGPTIPPQELPFLFERFHKLDKSRSENRDGWGLGLYIVKTIICGHGEDISVTSADGRTEFTFTLPLVN